jgi:hypothetical protein
MSLLRFDSIFLANSQTRIQLPLMSMTGKITVLSRCHRVIRAHGVSWRLMAKAFCVGGESGWVRLNNPHHFFFFFPGFLSVALTRAFYVN